MATFFSAGNMFIFQRETLQKAMKPNVISERLLQFTTATFTLDVKQAFPMEKLSNKGQSDLSVGRQLTS